MIQECLEHLLVLKASVAESASTSVGRRLDLLGLAERQGLFEKPGHQWSQVVRPDKC